MRDPDAPTRNADGRNADGPDATAPESEEIDQVHPDAEEVANEELPLDPAGPTEFGEAVDT